MFTFAFVCILPFSAGDFFTTQWATLTAGQILATVFIVVCATFIAYTLIVVGQKNLRPTVAGMYNYVQPIVATIVAVWWGMDSFNLSKCFAVALIFSGVYLVTTSKARQQEEK